MKEFNYSRAWWELALPAWNALPEAAKNLALLVADDCGDCLQLESLDTEWPEKGKLRLTMEGLKSEVLAVAAHTVWAMGHWCPGPSRALFDDAQNKDALALGKRLQATGGYWKFANYCDQILRARLNLSPRNVSHIGVSFAIHEGVLRVCWNHRDGWQWTEVGWATMQTWDRAQAAFPRSTIEKRLTEARGDKKYQAWDDYVNLLETACEDSFIEWDTTQYMEERKERNY